MGIELVYGVKQKVVHMQSVSIVKIIWPELTFLRI